ncbi:putative porin [Flavicella sediminum]|uniref:putative porin n=1 Tax=Flavicella sediminum TaxID=2585141 RepID=UPI00111F7A77|nr:putative porin [Flavicella sediminum]
MKHLLLILTFSFFCSGVFAQELDSIAEPTTINLEKVENANTKSRDSLKARYRKVSRKKAKEEEKHKVDEESGKANYLDYKIISHLNDTTLIDTTLTIQKEYQMNYLRKDLFGLHSYENMGQVYTSLTYDFNSNDIFPSLGAKAKHINYYEVEDIKYYRFPTPASEFLYKTGLEQGQVLDSRIAINIHDRLNLSLSYRGLRSLGSYRNSLSSHVNFRGTVSYDSKDSRYNLRMHIASQTIENQENGGITDAHVSNFEDNVADFDDRGKIDVNLESGTSYLVGKRYYFDQSYKLFKTNDSLPQKISNLKIGHIFNYETKQFKYNIDTSTDFFGDSFKTTTNDRTSNKTVNNQAYLDFTSPYILGNFRVLADYQHYFQGYKAIVIDNNQTIPAYLKGNNISLGAKWNAVIQNIYFDAEATKSIGGSLSGTNLYTKAYYKNKSGTEVSASLQLNSRAPDYTQTLLQSNFIAYNWYNDFKNVDTRNLKFEIKTKWINTSATLTQIENYIYFNADEQTAATQYGGTVNYLKLQANNEFKVGKFALNTTVLYQKVADGASVFRVPTAVGRSSFYYTSYFFKKRSLFLQTGVTANYFSAYKANQYNAVVGDFMLQDTQSIGGKPILDFFVNGQIRRTRIFLRAENVLSKISSATYYSAPNTPYRDFVIRFGVVWNFFN